MKKALVELCSIRDERIGVARKLRDEAGTLEKTKIGSIARFKENGDPALKELYARACARLEEIKIEALKLEEEIGHQNCTIDSYKGKLQELQQAIDDLKEEEAKTVADIVTHKRMEDINARLSGFKTDTQSKNLDAIREARARANASSALTLELEPKPLDLDVLKIGASAIYLDDFDKQVKVDQLFISAPVVDSGGSLSSLDNLFKE